MVVCIHQQIEKSWGTVKVGKQLEASKKSEFLSNNSQRTNENTPFEASYLILVLLLQLTWGTFTIACLSSSFHVSFFLNLGFFFFLLLYGNKISIICNIFFLSIWNIMVICILRLKLLDHNDSGQICSGFRAIYSGLHWQTSNKNPGCDVPLIKRDVGKQPCLSAFWVHVYQLISLACLWC